MSNIGGLSYGHTPGNILEASPHISQSCLLRSSPLKSAQILLQYSPIYFAHAVFLLLHFKSIQLLDVFCGRTGMAAAASVYNTVLCRMNIADRRSIISGWQTQSPGGALLWRDRKNQPRHSGNFSTRRRDASHSHTAVGYVNHRADMARV